MYIRNCMRSHCVMCSSVHGRSYAHHTAIIILFITASRMYNNVHLLLTTVCWSWACCLTILNYCCSASKCIGLCHAVHNTLASTLIQIIDEHHQSEKSKLESDYIFIYRRHHHHHHHDRTLFLGPREYKCQINMFGYDCLNTKSDDAKVMSAVGGHSIVVCFSHFMQCCLSLLSRTDTASARDGAYRRWLEHTGQLPGTLRSLSLQSEELELCLGYLTNYHHHYYYYHV